MPVRDQRLAKESHDAAVRIPSMLQQEAATNYKQTAELEDLRRFLEIARLPVEVVDERHGEPDFLLRDVAGSLIGMEHTTLTARGQKETHRYLITGFRRDLQARLLARGLIFRVVLGFVPNQATISRSKYLRTRTAQRIVEVVAAKAAEVKQQDLVVIRRPFAQRDLDPLRQAGLEGVLAELAIENDLGLSHPEVLVSPTSLNNPGLLVDQIERTIHSKEQKLAQYRENVGDVPVWLLIVTGHELSQAISPSEVTGVFRTSFDRVFLLNANRNRIQQLRTVAP
jgi:hypothetical protein